MRPKPTVWPRLKISFCSLSLWRLALAKNMAKMTVQKVAWNFTLPFGLQDQYREKSFSGEISLCVFFFLQEQAHDLVGGIPSLCWAKWVQQWLPKDLATSPSMVDFWLWSNIPGDKVWRQTSMISNNGWCLKKWACPPSSDTLNKLGSNFTNWRTRIIRIPVLAQALQA